MQKQENADIDNNLLIQTPLMCVVSSCSKAPTSGCSGGRRLMPAASGVRRGVSLTSDPAGVRAGRRKIPHG